MACRSMRCKSFTLSVFVGRRGRAPAVCLEMAWLCHARGVCLAGDVSRDEMLCWPSGAVRRMACVCARSLNGRACVSARRSRETRREGHCKDSRQHAAQGVCRHCNRRARHWRGQELRSSGRTRACKAHSFGCGNSNVRLEKARVFLIDKTMCGANQGSQCSPVHPPAFRCFGALDIVDKKKPTQLQGSIFP